MRQNTIKKIQHVQLPLRNLNVHPRIMALYCGIVVMWLVF